MWFISISVYVKLLPQTEEGKEEPWMRLVCLKSNTTQTCKAYLWSMDPARHARTCVLATAYWSRRGQLLPNLYNINFISLWLRQGYYYMYIISSFIYVYKYYMYLGVPFGQKDCLFLFKRRELLLTYSKLLLMHFYIFKNNFFKIM